MFCGGFSSLKRQAPPLTFCSLGVLRGAVEQGPNMRADSTHLLVTFRTSASVTRIHHHCPCVCPCDLAKLCD